MDFLWLGVLLERIGQTARTLDMHHHIQGAAEGQQPLLQTALWLSLLRACSGFEAFMRRQQGRVSRDAAVQFLLFEARFPRSLRYCIRSAVGLARRVAPPEAKGAMAAARTRLEALDRWLDDQEAKGIPLSVHALLTHVVDEAGATCGELQHGVEGATELVIASRDRDEAAQ
jgi:uncharacterized alpha-E superfamily protein